MDNFWRRNPLLSLSQSVGIEFGRYSHECSTPECRHQRRAIHLLPVCRPAQVRSCHFHQPQRPLFRQLLHPAARRGETSDLHPLQSCQTADDIQCESVRKIKLGELCYAQGESRTSCSRGVLRRRVLMILELYD